MTTALFDIVPFLTSNMFGFCFFSWLRTGIIIPNGLSQIEKMMGLDFFFFVGNRFQYLAHGCHLIILVIR